MVRKNEMVGLVFASVLPSGNPYTGKAAEGCVKNIRKCSARS